MKLIVIALGIISVCVMLLLERSNSNWHREVSVATAMHSSGEESDPQNLARILQGPPLKRWWSEVTELNALMNLGALTDKRVVSVDFETPFAALLAAGELAPEEVFKEVYAAARAPAQLIALCNELLATIADKCDLAKPKGQLTSSGAARLSGHLRFIPKDHPGEMPLTGNAQIISVPLGFSRGAKVPNTPRGRQEFLTLARDSCDAVRSVVGNCVINHVAFKADPRSFAEGKPLMNVRLKLAVVADPATINMDAIYEAVKASKRVMSLYKKS